MVLQTQALIIVAAYLIVMLLVGFIVGKLKIKDSSDYMLAGRRMGLFMVAFSLSANNIGGTVSLLRNVARFAAVHLLRHLFGPHQGAESLRRMGNECDLVCTDRIHRYDPIGLFRPEDPQNHGCDHS